MAKSKITIIGAGNMGGAILNGLLKSGTIDSSEITVADRNKDILYKLQNKGITVYENNLEAAENAKIIIIAVKPYLAGQVINEIKPVLKSETRLISIMAGVGIEQLEELAGKDIPVFRVMPNTAIALQESLTCISMNQNAREYEDEVKSIFDNLGETIIIDEKLMSSATVLSSCGIAFALRYIRAAMQGGVEIGFPAELAKFITAQTVKGAAKLMLEAGTHPEKEIDRVTTPGGITIVGTNEMEHRGFSSSIIQGILASYKKVENS